MRTQPLLFTHIIYSYLFTYTLSLYFWGTYAFNFSCNPTERRVKLESNPACIRHLIVILKHAGPVRHCAFSVLCVQHANMFRQHFESCCHFGPPLLERRWTGCFQGVATRYCAAVFRKNTAAA